MISSTSLFFVAVSLIASITLAQTTATTTEATTTTTTTAGPTTTTTTAGPTTTTTTPAPFQGYYLKDPAGLFLTVIFSCVLVGLITTLIFHNVIQPRFAFLTAPSDSQLLGVRSSTNNNNSSKNYSFHQQNVAVTQQQIDSQARYSGIDTGDSFG